MTAHVLEHPDSSPGADVVTGVLLADPDPISRYVLTGVLAGSPRLHLTAATDLVVAQTWSLDGVDVVVLCPGVGDDAADHVRALRRRGCRVVVLGARWSKDDVARAIAAGAQACLVKQPGAGGLVDAVQAVHAGHRVLAPELLEVLVEPTAAPSGPDPDATRRVSRLSSREHQVLTLLADGCSTDEAASRLCVSRATVKSHVSHSLTKLGARSRLEAVLLVRSVLG